MSNRNHKAWKILFRTLLFIYLCTVLFLCFAKFDPDFIQKESELFNLTDKDVHFLMFIPFVPLCFLAFGKYDWKWSRLFLFSAGLLAAAALSALLIEMLQGTTEYRGLEWMDAVAGICGASTGAAVLLLTEGAVRLCRKRMFVLLLLLLSIPELDAQQRIISEYRNEIDSLIAGIQARTGVKTKLELKKVLRRGGKMDFYFSRELGDYPWQNGDIEWLKGEIRKIWAGRFGKFSVGEVFASRTPVRNYVTVSLGNDGHPSKSPNKTGEPSPGVNVVRRLDLMPPSKGLSGRNIALWQSHGYYYEPALDRWEWQRACLWRTVEDIFTQSFVTQFLVPMLENAGAYVMLPRERDLNPDEYIIDNDGGHSSRTSGRFSNSGKWSRFDLGFADSTETIADSLNPFLAGSSLRSDRKGRAAAQWTARIRRDGEYAVYVSYRSFPESSENAHYSISHAGGSSEFLVNQKLGGGTWIYLGTFPFKAGIEAKICLDSGEGQGVLSADAVRIGGGRGNIARGPYNDISSLPRALEGARYALQWYGAPPKVWHPWNEEENDYRDDYTSRGLWTGWLSGGSAMNRKEKGLGIPLDLAFAFHTDAGTALRDSTIGTLVLYSSANENKRTLPSGEKMSTSREYAQLVQSQVVSDIRETFAPNWTRREIRDRSYMETRSPACPSMILELLSHQNFTDMKYGLDPAFRFVASRAVYKGMLKYLSNRYGVDYVVQPLPVESFSAVVDSSGIVCLSWKDREDRLEPTAVAEKYLLQRRKDDGAFSNPEFVQTEKVDGRVCCRVKIEKGAVWSFRVSAWNEGGASLPSEILAVGRPLESKGNILIVNNFDRVSAPVHFEDGTLAGFNADLDSGVDYGKCINYVGEMYEFRKGLDWADDDCPGFGASFTDCAELCPAGNSFDYCYVHGKSLMALGYGFDSVSARSCAETATEAMESRYAAIDVICGKQVGIPGCGGRRFSVFPESLRNALTSSGLPLIVSGCNIGSDPEGGIFPDDRADSDALKFTSSHLGFRLMNSRASRKGSYRWTVNRNEGKFNTEYSEDIYRIESPDGIVPAQAGASTIIRYSDSGISAGVAYKGENGQAVSFGFPIETVNKTEDIEEIFRFCLEFFNKDDVL